MRINKISLVLDAIIALNIALSISFYVTQANIDERTKFYIERVVDVQKKLGRVTEISKKILLPRAERKSSSERKNVRYYQGEEIATKYARQLFTVLLTFSNSKEYTSRAEKIRYMLSSEVLTDKRLFGSDKDSTGAGAVDVLQLKSKFESIQSYCTISSNRQVIVISKVKFTASKADYEPGREIIVYVSKFDIAKKQFTEISRLGALDGVVD